MFKVKKVEHTNKTFRLPVELVKKMESLAQNRGVSLNNLVIQCCEYALENIENSDDETKQLYNLKYIQKIIFQVLTFEFCCDRILTLEYVLWIRIAQRAVGR